MAFAMIFILAVIGIGLFVAVEALEHRLTPWSAARRAENVVRTS